MEENTGGVRDQWEHGHEDENWDDEGTDGISNADVVLLNEEGGEDHSHTAECVRKNMKENTMHVVILVVSERDDSLHGDGGRDGRDGRDGDHNGRDGHDCVHVHVHDRDRDLHD